MYTSARVYIDVHVCTGVNFHTRAAMTNHTPQSGEVCTQCGFFHKSRTTCRSDEQVCAWYNNQPEERLSALPGYEDGLTPRQAWNLCFRPSPAHKRHGESLAARSVTGQGADTTFHGEDSGLLHAARRIEAHFRGYVNVDDLVHVALSNVFGKLRVIGFGIEEANSAIYQSLDRLGYLERGK
jgi:hypothetical protein